VPHLPPTDSRLRPDQQAVEKGDFKLAAFEKNRLEDK
jgi:oxysterol-binding protein 1